MVQRVVILVLVLVLGALHMQLWTGRGSVPAVKEMRRTIAEREAANARSRQFNDRLASEVGDLKEGLEMVEEKARSELGMVKPNEVLVQITR